jgi:hypothetical protein
MTADKEFWLGGECTCDPGDAYPGAHRQGCGFEPAPVVVCICGSMRFQQEMQQAAIEMSLAGYIVVMPHCNLKVPSPWWPTDRIDRIKVQLDYLHKAKISHADEVLVVCPDGYIGDSTRAEIVYAEETHKPVSYWYAPGCWEGHIAIAVREAHS